MSNKKLIQGLYFDSDIIKEYCESYGLSQAELATDMGVDASQFSRYMRKEKPQKPRSATLLKLIQKHPYLEEKLRKKQKLVNADTPSNQLGRVYYIEQDAMNYFIRYNTKGELVLRSSTPDEYPDVKITYTKIEPI